MSARVGSDPLRIGLFLPSLTFGGAEIVTLNLAEGLLELGHEVDIVLASKTGDLLSKVPDGARVVDLASRRTLTATVPLARYLRTAKPHLLVAAMGHANIVAMWARRLARSPVRVVLTEHRSAPEASTSAVETVFRRLARFEYPRATALIAVSNGVADNVATVSGVSRNRISVVYNPVLSSSYWKQLNASLEHAWFEPGGEPVVLAVGRLVSDKDFGTLIRAFKLVLREHRAKLLVLGEGELRGELESLVHELELDDCVALPGFEANPYKFMAASAVFVLSSVSEGLPTVLIEAIAAGTPVVSTDCVSGPSEILAVAKVGELVPVGSPDQMARAISSVLDQWPNAKPPAPRLEPFMPAVAASRYLDVAFGKLDVLSDSSA